MFRNHIATIRRHIASAFRSTPSESQDQALHGNMTNSETQSWTTHDSNLALFECLSQPGPKRPALPAEIILLILAHPSRWIELHRESYQHSGSPNGAPSSFREGTDRLPIIVTRALSAGEVAGLTRIIFTFCTQDQGWSSYPEHHGTYNCSSTWMETGITLGDGSEGMERWELQRNRHAGQKPEYYKVEFDQNHKLIRSLEEGDHIGMWARARYPAWVHRVFGANIELVFYGVDDLED